MKRIRMPGDLDVPMMLFGRFTVKDIVRLVLPITPGLVSASLLATLVGALVGVAWYAVRPYGRAVDSHLYHLVRGTLWNDEVTDSDIGVFESSNWEGVDDKKIKTSSGSLVAVILVQPTNLDLKTSAEQGAIHSIYQNLLKTVNYPIQIHSQQKQLDLDQYLRFLENGSGADNALKSDYIEYCEGFEDNDLTQTRHYIVIHADPDGISYLRKKFKELRDEEIGSQEETLGNELESRCREIINEIDTADLSATRLTGTRLREFAEGADSTLEEVTPKHVVGDEFRRVIQIDEYPSNVEMGWPLQLLRTQGKVDVVQKVEPCSTGKTTKRLQRLSEKLNAEIDSLLAGGHRGTNKIESLLDDTEWFLDLLAERKGQPVEYSTCVVVHSESKEAMDSTFDKVCNRLDTLGFGYSHPVLKTGIAYRSASPLYRNGLDNSLLVPASSAAAGFPFATQNTEDSGVVFGTDVYDGTPLLLDRFTWSSHSMARMGAVGSGKSYAAKIELLRSALVYTDLEIIVVDPKQEYDQIIRALGGEVKTLDEETDYSFDSQATCFTVEERGEQENVGLLTDVVEQIYSHVSRDQEKTLVLVDESRILLNDEDGRRILNQFVLEGRDTNTAVTLITQNASHFTHCREGREILDNTPGKIFMRHDRVPESVVDYFNLSQREKQELYELKTGTDSPYSESLLHVSGRIKTRSRIESTAQEHALIQGGEQQ